MGRAAWEVCAGNLESWEQSQHVLVDRGKPRKPVSRWQVAGPSGCILTSSQQCDKQKIKALTCVCVCVLLLYWQFALHVTYYLIIPVTWLTTVHLLKLHAIIIIIIIMFQSTARCRCCRLRTVQALSLVQRRD